MSLVTTTADGNIKHKFYRGIWVPIKLQISNTTRNLASIDKPQPVLKHAGIRVYALPGGNEVLESEITEWQRRNPNLLYLNG